MNAKMLWATMAALAVTFAAAPARADDPTPEPKKAATAKLTPAEKEAARAKRKAETADAKAKGDVTKAGEGAPNTPYKASGTHDSRSAERKEKRKEVAADVKAGNTMKPGEAADVKK